MSNSQRLLASAAGIAALAALAGGTGTASAQDGSRGASAPTHSVSAAERAATAKLDFAKIARTATAMPMPKNVPGGGTSAQRGAQVSTAPTATSQDAAERAVMRATGAGALWPLARMANPNRQIGKLYFDTDPGPGYRWSWCTATAVNSENKSTVLTAGHCVWDANNRRWYTNWLFYPGYEYGASSAGVWSAKTASTTWNYYNAARSADDMGAVVLNTDGYGRRFVNLHGGHGTRFNGATNQYRTSLGYPITDSRWPGYVANGEDARYCQGTDYYYGSGSFAGQNYLYCYMTGGASGGPWLTSVNSSWMGYVNSVNSNKGGIGSSWAHVMFGPYFGNEELQVFNTVRNL